MDFVQIKRRVREYAENQTLSVGVGAILRSSQILENIRRMFLLSIWATETMHMKHSPNVLDNQTRLQNRLHTPERPWFSAYSALY